MIPRDCKRLAEVDFPIATVSRHAAREKSVRHGHPSTLHLWWARRPLASSRAMLLALLLPDPADPLCPAAFKVQARAALQHLPNMGGARGTDDLKLREAILRFIGDCADWDRSADMAYLTAARALIHATHGQETPLVVDPFAGGGSIPLEALRLGCDVYASDLNPVACLILKTMLEDVPRHGPGLAEKVRTAGAEVRAAAERELGRFYPLDPDGARPIAYLWARTVRCEASECGAEIPLARSFWLATKKNRRRALRYNIERPKDHPPRLRFEVFEPTDESEVPCGTVSRATAICACCGKPLGPDRVRAQLRAQRGGADVVFDDEGQRIGGATMLAIVTQSAAEIGRLYRPATAGDYAPVYDALRAVECLPSELRAGVTPVPNEPTPKGGGSGAGRAFSIYNYGMTEWSHLFVARQRLALAALSRIVSEFESTELYVKEILGLAVSRWADISNALCRWESTKNQVRNLFTRQAISVVWDFAEAGVFAAQAGDFSVTLESMLRTIERLSPISMTGQVGHADACKSKLPSEVAQVWFTDPPYYDAIPYSDLSDFFFVWLKRALPASALIRDVVEADNSLTPKIAEIVQDETKTFGARPACR
jgi:adenine-specific DNA methylase